MNWKWLRLAPWLDTRARFVAGLPVNARLLDLGCADGHTLRHFLELRPDLQIYAVDLVEHPDVRGLNCQFHRADLERDALPWPDSHMEAVTCMHLLEHLREPGFMLDEVRRVLKPGARAYFELPRPKTLIMDSPRGTAASSFTLNFYDDPGHVRFVSTGRLAHWLEQRGLRVLQSGVSRNWLFALAYPVLWLGGRHRRRFVAYAHWVGWSAYLVAEKCR